LVEKPKCKIKVVFVEPESEGNVGAIARIMKNFGFKELILVNPKTELGGEARAFAMHGIDILENAKIVDSFQDAVKDADFIVGTTAIKGSDYNILRVSITPDQLTSISDISGTVAFIFGRESSGLKNDELDKCDLLVSIPTAPEYPTLNVSQSAAIILYEVFKILKKCETRFREANNVEKNILLTYFEDILKKINFPKHKRYIAFRAFRNIIGRAFISGREAHTLIGVFRRIKEKVETQHN